MTCPAGHPVEVEVTQLGGLDLALLRKLWSDEFGQPPPHGLRREFLARAIVYRRQVRAFGGLPAVILEDLRRIAESAREGAVNPLLAAPQIKPGTRLVRSYSGKTHTVSVLADGFEWDGRRYRSLSAIARAITGTQWNGNTFFGLKRPPGSNKNAAGPHRRGQEELGEGAHG